MLSNMDSTDAQRVAARLRLVIAELQMETVKEFAEALGAERSAVSNWLNGYNLPPVPMANRMLALLPGLTLDWVYRGDASAIPVGLAVRLGALEEVGYVPAAEEPPRQKAQGKDKAKGPARASARRRQVRQAT